MRGRNVFAGYWRAPEKTAASFVHDELGRRWFRTGDLARQDPETGFITLLGRRHELIISGGFNLYPREVEEVLAGFPGVREAAVVGRPHPDWGEVPVAFLAADAERRHGRADRLLQVPDGRLQGAAGDPADRFPAPERPGKSGEAQASRLTVGQPAASTASRSLL